MRKLRKILLSTIFALTVSTTFFANTAGTQTVTAASGTAVTFKRKVIAYLTGSVTTSFLWEMQPITAGH